MATSPLLQPYPVRMALMPQVCSDLLRQRALLSALLTPLATRSLLTAALGLGPTAHADAPPPGQPGRKGISCERTFRPVSDPQQLRSILSKLAASLAEDLAREGIAGRTLTLKLKTTEFEVRTRATSLARAICSQEALLANGLRLLEAELPLSLRLLGLRMSNLCRTQPAGGANGGSGGVTADMLLKSPLGRLWQKGSAGRPPAAAAASAPAPGGSGSGEPAAAATAAAAAAVAPPGECWDANADALYGQHWEEAGADWEGEGEEEEEEADAWDLDVGPAPHCIMGGQQGVQQQEAGAATDDTGQWPAQSPPHAPPPPPQPQRQQQEAQPSTLPEAGLQRSPLLLPPAAAAAAAEPLPTPQRHGGPTSHRSKSASTSMWTCQACTFAENPPQLLRCSVCDTHKRGNPSFASSSSGAGAAAPGAAAAASLTARCQQQQQQQSNRARKRPAESVAVSEAGSRGGGQQSTAGRSASSSVFDVLRSAATTRNKPAGC